MESVANIVARYVAQCPDGVVFGYWDLNVRPQDKAAAAKALARLLRKGVIRRLIRGYYYKPISSVFGLLQPRDAERLKPYLFHNGRRIGYLTGPPLYNLLGLTHQMSVVVHIGTRVRRRSMEDAPHRIVFVKSYAEVTNDNHELLGLLDAMNDLDHIPDADIHTVVCRFRYWLGQIHDDEKRAFVGYALAYPPRVRALLGALLDSRGERQHLDRLRASLNPRTRFALGISPKTLRQAPRWNID